MNVFESSGKSLIKSNDLQAIINQLTALIVR